MATAETITSHERVLDIIEQGISRENVMPEIINTFNLSYGVEIGVWKGEFSELLLNTTKLGVLHGCDIWEGRKGKNNYQNAVERLKKFGSRSHLHVGPSPQAASLFEDESLDFIYIDADHTYEGCKADIKGWWPKCKPGGFFGGHDYAPRRNRAFFGVIPAVDEFAKQENLHLYVTKEDGRTWNHRLRTWWVFKPL